MLLKKFRYRKPNGEESNRTVFVLSKPSDMYFGIDLSEFDEDEKSFYESELRKLYNGVEAAIEDMGLNNNYRNFKQSRIIES